MQAAMRAKKTCLDAHAEFKMLCSRAMYETSSTMHGEKSHGVLLAGASVGALSDSKESTLSQAAALDSMRISSPVVPATFQMSPPLQSHGASAAAVAAQPARSSHLHLEPPAASHQSDAGSAAYAASRSPSAGITEAWEHKELVRILVLPGASPVEEFLAGEWMTLVALVNEIANIALATTQENRLRYIKNTRAHSARLSEMEKKGIPPHESEKANRVAHIHNRLLKFDAGFASFAAEKLGLVNGELDGGSH